MSQRTAAELPSLGDLQIDLGKADEEASTPGDAAGAPADDLPDIPVEGSPAPQATAPTQTQGQPETDTAKEDSGLDLDFDSTSSPSDSKDSTGSSDKKKDQIDKIVNEIDKVKLETELSTMRAYIARIQDENTLLHNRFKELKQDFDSHVLFRIPKYKEIELPGSKFDPQYIVPHIGNALDKLFISVFRDVPMYDFKSFDVINKDQDGNINNALVKLCIYFDDTSAYKFLKFDLELWIIDGYLQIPQWFVYDKQIHWLTEEGIRDIQMAANRMDQADARNRNDTDANSWYNMDHGRKNPIMPHQVELPMSSHQTKVWPTHRPY